MVDSYEVTWQSLISDDGSGTSGNTGGDPTVVTDDGDEESGTSGSITDTSYTIEDLKDNTTYIIIVTATNPAGNIDSHHIKITTGKIFKALCIVWCCHNCSSHSFNICGLHSQSDG